MRMTRFQLLIYRYASNPHTDDSISNYWYTDMPQTPHGRLHYQLLIHWHASNSPRTTLFPTTDTLTCLKLPTDDSISNYWYTMTCLKLPTDDSISNYWYTDMPQTPTWMNFNANCACFFQSLKKKLGVLQSALSSSSPRSAIINRFMMERSGLRSRSWYILPTSFPGARPVLVVGGKRNWVGRSHDHRTPKQAGKGLRMKRFRVCLVVVVCVCWGGGGGGGEPGFVTHSQSSAPSCTFVC